MTPIDAKPQFAPAVGESHESYMKRLTGLPHYDPESKQPFERAAAYVVNGALIIAEAMQQELYVPREPYVSEGNKFEDAIHGLATTIRLFDENNKRSEPTPTPIHTKFRRSLTDLLLAAGEVLNVPVSDPPQYKPIIAAAEGSNIQDLLDAAYKLRESGRKR